MKRHRATNLTNGNVKDDDKPNATCRAIAIENPGYDVAVAFDSRVGLDCSDMGQVTFSPFEEDSETSGAVNPVYTYTELSAAQSSPVPRRITIEGSTDEWDDTAATSDRNAIEGEAVGEFTDKEKPFAEEKDAAEKPHDLLATVQKEAVTEEEPRRQQESE